MKANPLHTHISLLKKTPTRVVMAMGRCLINFRSGHFSFLPLSFTEDHQGVHRFNWNWKKEIRKLLYLECST